MLPPVGVIVVLAVVSEAVVPVLESDEVDAVAFRVAEMLAVAAARPVVVGLVVEAEPSVDTSCTQ